MGPYSWWADANVTVTRDTMVCRILWLANARSTAQGPLVHAQDRLYQMFFRNCGRGTVGRAIQRRPRYRQVNLRTIGSGRGSGSRMAGDKFRGGARRHFRAYADGVNDFVQLLMLTIPIEFTLLGSRIRGLDASLTRLRLPVTGARPGSHQ